MKTRLFKRHSSSSSPSPGNSSSSQSPRRHTFSESLMDENIAVAESLITKWGDHSSQSTHHCDIFSLFRHNRQEARLYLQAVKNLHSSMKFFISQDPASQKLVRTHNLMRTSMKRLQTEFYQILKASRECLDPETVSSSTHSSRASARSRVSMSDDESQDEFRLVDDSVSAMEKASMVAMVDLQAIAECMISSGYGQECVKIYKVLRKSIVDEALNRLGVESLNLPKLQKMDWEVIELKIKSWLNAVKIAVKTLFYSERVLCDHVFSASSSISESCFAQITVEGATTLFGFPETVAKCKKTPEKMFRTLDLYEAVAIHWPEIESIFSFESTSAVRSQALNSLIALSDAVRTMLLDFESAIQKDPLKPPLPGGGLHPLTRHVMDYTSFLSDYRELLADIVAGWSLNLPFPLPESYFVGSKSPLSIRMAWLILILLCKLDGKAGLYGNPSLSYLFLANNLQYVVVKVRNSNLKYILGDDWIAKHKEKVKQYAGKYEHVAWSKVSSILAKNLTARFSVEQAKECFARFNSAFEEAYRKQGSWVVSDPKLQDEIKVSVSKRLVPGYRDLYQKYRFSLRDMGCGSVVRFAPDDLDNYLSDLFNGKGSAGSDSSFSSSLSSSPGHARKP